MSQVLGVKTIENHVKTRIFSIVPVDLFRQNTTYPRYLISKNAIVPWNSVRLRSVAIHYWQHNLLLSHGFHRLHRYSSPMASDCRRQRIWEIRVICVTPKYLIFERLLTIIHYIPLPPDGKPLFSRHARQEREYDQRAVREKRADVCCGKERIAIFAASLRRKDILRRTFDDAVPTGKFW